MRYSRLSAWALLFLAAIGSAGQRLPAPQISQYIRRIFQDSKGNVWFGTNNDGEARYDGKTLTYFARKEGFCGEMVRGMLEDAAGNVWFATSGGVCRFDGKSFDAITRYDGLSSNEVQCILPARNGILWIGTRSGLDKYNGQHVTSFTLPAAKHVNWMVQDKDGNIWFCTDGKGVFRYDGRLLTNFSETEGLCNNIVETAYQDRAGFLWYGSRVGGLSRYNPQTNTFTNFTTRDGLCGDFVWTLLQDRTGTLWISTAGSGLCTIDRRSLSAAKPSFTAYGEKQGLRNRHVQSLLEDNRGRLWVGTSGGAFRYQNGRFLNITRTGPWE